MPFADFSGSYTVWDLKFLNWEPKPDLGPQGGPLGGPRPPDVHCTGPLRPNGQMPHGHAHGGCHDHGTLSSVLISGGEIGKRLARRFPILLLKTARARARCFPRAYRAHLRGHGSLSLGPTLSVVQSLPLRGHELLSAANLCADPRRWFLSSLQGERRCLNTFAPASHLHTAALP